jgi:dihydroneopterin aldolase
VVAAVERDPVDLIETVAERVAEVALGFERVESVRVTVHKPQAPITVPFDDVRVVIERSRA